MKKIDLQQLRQEKLMEIFAYLEPFFINRGAKIGKKTEFSRDVFGDGGDWSKMAKGSMSINAFRDKLRKGLDYLTRDLYEVEEGGYILVNSAPKLSQLIKDWSKDSDDYVSHYLYHYVANQKDNRKNVNYIIRQAHLVVNYRRKKACLVFFQSKQKRRNRILATYPSVSKLEELSNSDELMDISVNTDDWIIRRYHGEVEITGEACYLIFSRRVDPGVDGEEIVTRDHSLNVFNYNKDWGKLRPTSVGNFASIGPASGICVVQEYSHEEVLRKISGSPIDPSIQHLLIGKSYSYKNQTNLYNLQKHRKLLASLKPLIGDYIGISLISRHGRDSIGLASFSIEEAGRIRYKSESNPIEQVGYIFHITDLETDKSKNNKGNVPYQAITAISCCISYSNDYDHHRMFMVLDTNPSSSLRLGDKAMIGTYSGLYEVDDYPQSGRLMLVPADQCKGWGSAENIPMTATNRINKLMHDFPRIFEFFGGFLDDLADRPFRSNYDLMNTVAQPHRGNRNSVHRAGYYKGYYLLYYPSSNRNTVYRRVLHINPDSNGVTWYMKVKVEQGFEEMFTGYARIVDNALVLHFEQLEARFDEGDTDPPSFVNRGCSFYVGANPETLQLKEYLEGVVYRTNNAGHPVSSRCVIQFIGDETVEREWIEKHLLPMGDQAFTEGPASLNALLEIVGK